MCETASGREKKANLKAQALANVIAARKKRRTEAQKKVAPQRPSHLPGAPASEVGQNSVAGHSIYILSSDIPASPTVPAEVPQEEDGSSGSAEYPEGDTLDRRPAQYAAVSADPDGGVADPSFVVEEPLYSQISKLESRRGAVPVLAS